MTTREDQRPETEVQDRKAAFLAAARRFAEQRAGRRRSATVTVAAAFLAVYGLVFLAAALFDTEGETADRVVLGAVVGLPQVAAAAALMWGRRRGWWAGFVVAALGVLVVAVAGLIAGELGAFWIALVFAAIPLSLLLVPGSRFDAWRKVWGTFTSMVVIGGVFAVVGGVMLLAGNVEAAAAVPFGLAVLAVSPAFHPRPPAFMERRGMAVMTVASALLGLASLAMAVFGTASVLYPRSVQVVAGVIGFVFFGGGAVLLVVRGQRG